MSILSILNSFQLDSQGLTKSGKQGAIADALDTPYEVTVTGNINYQTGQIATASIVTLFDDDNNQPADWDYLYLWADQPVYLQLIGSGSNVIFKIAAYQPFVLPGFDSLLAAANTTPITTTEPTLTDIDAVVLGNYSGSTASYVFAAID